MEEIQEVVLMESVSGEDGLQVFGLLDLREGEFVFEEWEVLDVEREALDKEST